MASHIIKKTTSSAILRSAASAAQPKTSALSKSSPRLFFYHNKPSPRHFSDLELNNKLVNLAKRAQYDDAYRLCNHLLENEIHIQHHLVYEKAALAGVDLGRTNEGLEKFVLWFSLVPDRNELPLSLTSQPRYIYFDTRFSLLRCGNPKTYLKYIMIFGNIMAAKGHIPVSFLEIARVVVRFARKEVVVDYFKELEAATAYWWEQEPKVRGWILAWFWEVVIKLYLERGWLDLAFEVVVEKDGKFELSDELCRVLLKMLEASGDAERSFALRALLDRSAPKEVLT